jgi:hypothetical protein
MDGIAKRVEEGCNITVYVAVVMPHIGHWQGNVFAKCAGSIHANALGICTQVASSCQAVSAATTNDVTLSTNDIAWKKPSDIGTDFDDFSDKLVTNNERNGDGFLCPGVPFVNV